MSVDTLASSAETVADLAHLRINGDRLWQSLMDLAKIGATPKGGVCRLALTDLDRQGRDQFVQWCKEAGCSITIDAIGNIFARRPGKDNSLPPIMAGSHIDTQPTGGKFDGCFGVMAGLEVIRTLNDYNIETQAPVEVTVWTNEEGSRFAPCMMGSGVFIGKFDLEETYALADYEGVKVGDELKRIGYAGPAPVPGHTVGTYFEAHIEQGPILENEEKTIGVVIGCLGQKWFDLVLKGVESHAGPTPMHLRKDALLGAAEVIQAVNRIALEHQPYACGTCGHIEAYPGSRNVIPGEVLVSIDFRHLEEDQLAQMISELEKVLDKLKTENGLELELKPTANFPALYFHEDCVNAVRTGAQRLEVPHMDIVSGAGHDAIFMAEICPTGMIFVPCENGISHNEIENADPQDLATGCNVLLHAMLERAGV